VDTTSTALAILLLPLAAFVAVLALGKKLPREGDFVPTAATGLAAALSAKLFFGGVLGHEHGLATAVASYPWFQVGAWRFDFGVAVDNATALMLFVVTTVSFLVHVYSTAYMRDHHGHPEARYGRFFAYLALFTFAMLLIVVTDSLFFLYVGWELVGVCSYFLIGFYIERPAAARASAKAFIVNRVGDVGFFIGIAIVVSQVGSFDLADVFRSIRLGFEGPQAVWTPGLLTAAALALFCGAVGKSAQFPLHVWLPDAMEGPTPVSALIHAATMVAAGVYMVLRLFPIFAGPGFFWGDLYGSPALWVVAGIGTTTAVLGATIALVQTDLKRVLAYSTVSQLGFMMAGLGVGAYAGGFFHLFTHAWFKACLFLGAGAVHHAVQTYEMESMGGLRRRMPITFATYLVACAAIAGVPFLAGFWSKEAILGHALAFGLHHGGIAAMLPGLLLVATAALTAFYMFRTLWLVFTGEPREPERFSHAHEMPAAITGPLVALAVLAVLAGGVTPAGSKWFEARVSPATIVDQYMAVKAGKAWTHPAASHGRPAGAHAAPHGAEPLMGAAARFHAAEEAAHGPTLVLSLAAAAAGILGSWLLFAGPWRGLDVVGTSGGLAGARVVLVNLYYIDWFYTAVVAALVRAIAVVMLIFDKVVVDGLVNLWGTLGVLFARIAGVVDYWSVDGLVRTIGDATLAGGAEARRVQTGRLQEYLYLTLFLTAFIFGAWTMVELYL